MAGDEDTSDSRLMKWLTLVVVPILVALIGLASVLLTRGDGRGNGAASRTNAARGLSAAAQRLTEQPAEGCVAADSFRDERVKISSPKREARVAQQVTVRGIVTSPGDDRLYVFQFPDEICELYTNRTTDVDAQGRWRESEDVHAVAGHAMNLCALLVDVKGTALLQEVLGAGRESVAQLPRGADGRCVHVSVNKK